jgi:hypothetical protein
MKQDILEIAQDLEKGTISEDRARNLLLGLFSVSKRLSEGCRVMNIHTKEKGTIEIVGFDYYVVRCDSDGLTETTTEELINVC